MQVVIFFAFIALFIPDVMRFFDICVGPNDRQSSLGRKRVEPLTARNSTLYKPIATEISQVRECAYRHKTDAKAIEQSQACGPNQLWAQAPASALRMGGSLGAHASNLPSSL